MLKCRIIVSDKKNRGSIMSMSHLSLSLSQSSEMFRQEMIKLCARIQPFYVLFMFEQDEQPYDYVKLFETYQSMGTILKLEKEKIFHTSEVFIVKESAYLENQALFFQLRVRARERLIEKLAKSVIFYVVSQQQHLNLTLLQDQHLLDDSLTITKNVLKKWTFIGEEKTWDAFTTWYSDTLTMAILEDIVVVEGLNSLKKLPDKALNALFFAHMNDVANDETFIDKISLVVDDYIKEWQEQVILLLKKDLEVYIEVEKSVTQTMQNARDFSQLATVPHYMYVMNNTLYQVIREVLYQLNSSQTVYSFQKGKTKGTLFLKEGQIIDATMAVLAVDVLDILCGFFLHQSENIQNIVEIRLTDILMMRDIKQKLGGEGRRGGYEAKQKQQVLAVLALLKNIHVEIEQMVSYHTNQPTPLKLKGPLLVFEQEYCYKLGPIFTPYLSGSQRQLALLPFRAFHYHVYRFRHEKQLCRYLSWRWRTQASQAKYWQANKVSTLLKAIGETLNQRSPSRTRERFEKALDQLTTDGVIAGWHYVNWDEAVAVGKGWGNYWLNAAVIIEPPQAVLETYHSLEKKRVPMTTTKKENEEFAKQLANFRKSQHLTLSQAGEMLHVSAAYMSQLERNIVRPSLKLRKRLERWLLS